MERLYLIDASGFLYRAYFAIQGLSSKEGASTGALFGFIRSYLRLKEQFHPEHIVAVFDAERNKESRVKLYSEYKAHRKPTPDDLIRQILEAQEFCTLMGIPMLAVPGVEADDTMASVATWAKEERAQVFISTGDKDMAQLVDDSIRLINPHKDYMVIDAQKVEEQYGVPPSQMKDYLAIIGDSSDNIPGIEGFGPKTCVQLLKKYGSLASIYEHLEEIGGKKEASLKEQKEVAFLSQKLVALNMHVPFPKEQDFFALKAPDKPPLMQFLRKRNFLSLLKLAEDEKAIEPSSCRYHQIDSLQALSEMIKSLSHASEVCVDTETTATDPMRASLVGIGLGVTLDDAYYTPLNGSIPKDEVLKILKPFFQDPKRGFFGHNIKYDWHVLKNAGIDIAHISGDTIICSYLLNAHQRQHSLDELSLSYFGKRKIATSDLLGKGKSQITMDQVPIEKVSEYCCEDVECTVKLKGMLDQEITQRGLEKLLHEIEIPLITILAKMEQQGIFVDCEVLSKLSKKANQEIQRLQETIYQMAGEPFNLNSPKQLSDILFNKLGLPAPKKGKTGPSTSADVLESLSISYPIAQEILEYRTVEKLRSTYIDSLPGEVHPRTGRIHCTFNQSVAATGRLSSQDPNLQNIPVRSELGQLIRSAFRPQEPHWSFLSADYSQIELRILAHLSEDPGLLEAFHNDVDVHAYTASEIFHVPINQVTDQMRSVAKAVNFGIIYGQQAFGLSQQLKIPVSSAASFIEAYFTRYKRVREFLESVKKTAHETGKAVSLTGRERLLPDINSQNMAIRSAQERLAVNTPFQATAADIIKMAMIKVDQWLTSSKTNVRMLLQIHDELVFEMPDDEIETAKRAIQAAMEGVFTLKVPLQVKIGVGKNWNEC